MNRWKVMTWAASAGLVAFSAASVAAAAENKFEIYGFAMADYIQDFRRVDPAWEDTLRPSKIPTHAGAEGSDGQAMLSAKQSRFGAQMELPVRQSPLKTKFEFDMFGVGADEGKTTIRLRHAYGEWNGWLAGQTHSLFMDIDAFPNVIDYWGPCGMSFYRLPQIRYTFMDNQDGRFAVAIERPGNDIDPGNLRQLDPLLAPAGITLQNDEKLPDLTAQFRRQWNWGHVQLGGILRRVGFETVGTPNNSPSGFKTGWGLDLTSVIKFRERDKLYLSALGGQGIASYMNDGGTDLAPEGSLGSLQAKAVPLYAGMIYYDAYWSDHYASTFGYSRTQVTNTSFQAGSAYRYGEYASASFLYLPSPLILTGLELLWGRRVDRDGSSGNDVRTQISFKYSFSSTAKPEGA